MSLIIGLTGSLSTGKTLIASYFKKCGAIVIDSDNIVHGLLRNDKACCKKIIKEFGQGILINGEIDRRKVAGIVFKDAKKLRKLEEIVHPEVKKEIVRKANLYKKKHKNSIIVIEVPLLFESGLDKMSDYTVVVKSTVKQQIERSVKKLNITKAEAMRRIKAQMPLKEKVSLADIIIDNSKNKLIAKKEVEKICQGITRRIKN